MVTILEVLLDIHNMTSYQVENPTGVWCEWLESVAEIGQLRSLVFLLAHANCTLFCTPRAAFVCKKMTRNFPVFPPENSGFENRRISKTFFEAIGRLQVVKGIKKTIFLAC